MCGWRNIQCTKPQRKMEDFFKCEDVFPAQVGRLTNGSVSVIHHDPSAPLLLTNAQSVVLIHIVGGTEEF